MSDIEAYSIITADINFSLISTEDSGNTNTETSSINYEFEFADGSGIGEIDYAVSVSGNLAANSGYNFNFQQFPKSYFGLVSAVNFDTIKGIIVKNLGATIGSNLNIHATGSYAFTGIFNNNNTGNYLIKPSGVWLFTDVMSGVKVTANHNYLTLKNVSSTGIDWRMTVVGTTGNITGNFSYS